MIFRKLSHLLALIAPIHAHRSTTDQDHNTPDSAWSYLPITLPFPLSDMSINIINNKIILTGGCNATNGNVFVEDPVYGEMLVCFELTNAVVGVTPVVGSSSHEWEESLVEELEVMPRKRARHASAVVKTGTVELLCVFGGRDEMDGLVKEIDCYDPTTNTWSTPTSLSDQYLTSDCAAVTIDDSKIYLMGGYDAEYNALDQVTILDMSDLSNIAMSAGPTLVTKRGDVDAAVIGNDIYISGGFTHENNYASPHDSVERLDVSSSAGTSSQWTSVDNLDQERGDKQLVALDGKLYALGGETKLDVTGTPQEELPALGEISTILDTVEVYDPAQEDEEGGALWNPLGDMPATLFRFSASEWEGSDGEGVIFVFGGQIGYNADCECFATTDKVMLFNLAHASEDIGGEGDGNTSAGVMIGFGVQYLAMAAFFSSLMFGV